MVKGQEYKERQISELDLRTEQRQVMDKDVKDTTILKSDLGEGLQLLEDTLPSLEADANAINAGDLPTSDLGTDALFSRGDEAINQSSPFTQRMASLFASASLEPEDGWNDGNVEEVDDTVNSTSPQGSRQKLIQFSEIGNVFEDYYIIQDPTGPHRADQSQPIEDDEESENYGKWKREKVQMKISCGPTSPGDIELGDPAEYKYTLPGWGASAANYVMLEDSMPRGAGRGNYKDTLGFWNGSRMDSIYSTHLFNRPYRTVAEHSGSCVKPMYEATFQECADACEDSDECSAFSIAVSYTHLRAHET